MNLLKKNNKRLNELPEEIDILFRKLNIPSSVNKDEAWDRLLNKIANSSDQPKIHSLSGYSLRYSFAAAIILLIIVSWFYIKFSTTTIICPIGKQINVVLPDNSKITLNAETQIKYPKYFIFNSKKVLLDGEAIFLITKGDNFKVYDKRGNKVEVLGTQFNITTRNNQLKVQCFEGIVKVTSYKGKSLNLIKGFTAEVLNDSIRTNPLPPIILEGPGWTKGEFFFESANLNDVLDELQRQFSIKVITFGFDPSNRTYTGVFYKKDLHEALKMVTIPMNLQYEFESDSVVIVKPNQ